MNNSIVSPPHQPAVDGGTEQGITWAVCRGLFGSLNGYVKLPDGHPWVGLHCDDVPVEAHGGLTFAMAGWIGFDTVHAGDHWPDMPYHSHNGWCIHWTPELVVAETQALACRIANRLRVVS